MPSITEPEPEVEDLEVAAAELVSLLLHEHPAVVDQALQAVLSYSDDPEGIALLRDLPVVEGRPDAPQALLQLAERSVAQPKVRTDAVIALVNLSSDAAIASDLSQAGVASTALALAAAAGSGAAAGGVDAQHRLLQLCCNLTRNNSAVAALLGDEEADATPGRATEQLGRITEQLLTAVDGGDVTVRPALGALLRMLTNVTAEEQGQTYVMTLLSSLLRDSVVQSEDDDVRAGLCVLS